MSGCLERIRQFEVMEFLQTRRNLVASVVSGVLVSVKKIAKYFYQAGPWLGFKNCGCSPLIFWGKGTSFNFIYEKFRVMSHNF